MKIIGHLAAPYHLPSMIKGVSVSGEEACKQRPLFKLRIRRPAVARSYTGPGTDLHYLCPSGTSTRTSCFGSHPATSFGNSSSGGLFQASKIRLIAL